MAAVHEAGRIEVRLAAELHDAIGDGVRVLQLLPGMLQEFLRGDLALEAARHEIVVPVAKDADQLRRQRLVQQLQDLVAIGVIALRDRAFLDMPAGFLA